MLSNKMLCEYAAPEKSRRRLASRISRSYRRIPATGWGCRYQRMRDVCGWRSHLDPRSLLNQNSKLTARQLAQGWSHGCEHKAHNPEAETIAERRTRGKGLSALLQWGQTLPLAAKQALWNMCGSALAKGRHIRKAPWAQNSPQNAQAWWDFNLWICSSQKEAGFKFSEDLRLLCLSVTGFLQAILETPTVSMASHS